MKKLLFLLIAFIGLSVYSTSSVNAQGVSINASGAPPDGSAGMDVNFTNKGMLIPRMTTAQRDSIHNPAEALQIYNTTTKCYETWEYGFWQEVWCATCAPAQPSAISGNASACQGTAQTYSVFNVLGVTYTWTFPSGWTQTGGGTSNSVTVTVGSGSGNVQVTPSTVCSNGTPQTLAVTSTAAPGNPTASTNAATLTQITWNWNPVQGATGYKYNTINNYSTAIDNGNNTSYVQTGLTCYTAYTLYVWAYNSCGNSSSTALSQSTPSCCTMDGTGGAITHVGGYTIHTFTSNGTFAPACAMNVKVLVVGGGGGGGNDGGGGGAGGFIYDSSYAVLYQGYAVTAGAGGAGGGYNADGVTGSNSVFDTLTAYGGGGGGGNNLDGLPGGSGGGGGGWSTTYTGGNGTNGQGNAGGANLVSADNPGGGGGGAGAVGQDGQSGTQAGNGGIGLQCSISGTPVYYAGGGGGGFNDANQACTAGTGGNGGGGAGCNTTSCTATAGTPNTGGGGGGSTNNGGKGGAGGSGVVIISYLTP